MANVDVETVFNAPKRKPEDDPVLDRMIRDMARHETKSLNVKEIGIQNQEDNARQALINMGQLGPMEILAYEEELHEIAESRRELKAERKAVARMRTQKSRALMKKALIEKRAKAKKAERKRILNRMKGK